jgi:hypothetical protein
MPELTIDPATVDSLTAKLDRFSNRLTDDERTHLLALLALATTEVAEANHVTIEEPDVELFGAGSGFGTVLSPLNVTGNDGGCIPDPFDKFKRGTVFNPVPPDPHHQTIR